MILALILTLICLIGAGFFKGRLDAIADEGVKTADWKKKYADPLLYSKNHWWYLGLYKPTYDERFPFSTTLLVFLTDSWHRNQFFMLRCLYSAIALGITGDPLIFAVLILIAFPIGLGVAFQISYLKKRLKIKTKRYELLCEITGDEPWDSQVTSVPEKQINDDELH